MSVETPMITFDTKPRKCITEVLNLRFLTLKCLELRDYIIKRETRIRIDVPGD
jgi:hypothetical protein